MQRFVMSALALTCFSFGNTLPAPADQITTGEVIRSTPTQSTPVRSTPISYETLRKTFSATRVTIPQDIYTNLATMEGRVVEMQGEVAGTLAREGKRTVLLRMDNEMAVMLVGPELADLSTLRHGSMVSVLARVEKKESGNDALLTIIATSPKVDTPRPVASAPIALDNSVIIVPPMASTSVPRGQAPQNPAPAGPRLAPATNASTSNSALGNDPSQSIEAQKPAYKALVRRHNKKLTEAQTDEIATALLDAAFANKMDPRFLAAIIAVESDFDIYCLSKSGAMGLGQLMPFNLKRAGIRDPWNPTQNVHGTARYLRGLLNNYANRSDGTLLAVAAYNAGEGAVRRAGYKVPNGAQVQRYVWKVYHRYKEFAPDKF